MEDDSAGEDQEYGNDRDQASIQIRPISASDPAVAPGASPSRRSVTLALPIQAPRAAGAGREDCWSEGATEVLIDAWAERYLQLSRGNLKHNHWREVADAVASREDYGKAPKTDVQCKNRIDTLKKKYKVEKGKVASGAGSSWIFFHRLDRLIGSTPSSKTKSPALPTSQPPPVGKLIFSVPTKARSVRQVQANSDDSSESLPPGTVNGKKRKLDTVGDTAAGDSTRELTRAIEKLGEVYEKVEKAKLKQVVEMEKERLGFLRELESQRMQFYMKTQMEMITLDN